MKDTWVRPTCESQTASWKGKRQLGLPRGTETLAGNILESSLELIRIRGLPHPPQCPQHSRTTRPHDQTHWGPTLSACAPGAPHGRPQRRAALAASTPRQSHTAGPHSRLGQGPTPPTSLCTAAGPAVRDRCVQPWSMRLCWPAENVLLGPITHLLYEATSPRPGNVTT